MTRKQHSAVRLEGVLSEDGEGGVRPVGSGVDRSDLAECRLVAGEGEGGRHGRRKPTNWTGSKSRKESGAAVFALLRSFVVGGEALAPFDVVCHVPAFSNDRPPFPTLLARLSTSGFPAFGARQILSISRGPLVPGQSTALHPRSARTAADRVSWPSLRPRSSGISTAPEWAHKGVRESARFRETQALFTHERGGRWARCARVTCLFRSCKVFQGCRDAGVPPASLRAAPPPRAKAGYANTPMRFSGKLRRAHPHRGHSLWYLLCWDGGAYITGYFVAPVAVILSLCSPAWQSTLSSASPSALYGMSLVFHALAWKLMNVSLAV